MSRRPGSSRTLGPVKQCSIYVRGGLRCAWCCAFLASPREATIDHLDADPSNNDATNLVPSCAGCNSARAWDWFYASTWTRARAMRFPWESFARYLEHKGASILDAIERVEAQRFRDLPRSAGALLARRWHPRRMRARALSSARYRARTETERRERRSYDREERLAIQGRW